MLLDKKHSGHNSGVFLEDQSNIREVRKKKYYRRFDSVLQVRMQYTTKKQVLFDHHVDYSPIAISLGSYMDKAAGRRACTRKKITQDVSVLSRSCLGDVSVMSHSCLGLVSVFFW